MRAMADKGCSFLLTERLHASLPQVMYFSSLFPYLVLFCFLVRGLMLKGSVDGIAHMFTPKVTPTASTRLLFPYKNK